VRRFICVFVAIAALRAQSATFDVASVKPNLSGATMFRIGYLAGGRFTVSNATVFALIASAFGPLSASQIVGGPNWITTERFDIEAKTEKDPPRDPDGVPRQMLQMAQALLAERFQLAVHRERRELPIYALVFSRTDRRPAPQMHRVDTDCATARTRLAGAGTNTGANPTNRPPCAIGGATGSLVGGAATMEQLASTLSNRVDRVVVDRTGATERFDFDLTWSREDVAAPDSGTASMFTALQEQLGLKLEPTRGAVDVLVIDRVERPKSN